MTRDCRFLSAFMECVVTSEYDELLSVFVTPSVRVMVCSLFVAFPINHKFSTRTRTTVHTDVKVTPESFSRLQNHVIDFLIGVEFPIFKILDNKLIQVV